MNQKGIEIQTRDYERQRYSTDYTKDFPHQTVLPLSNCDICTHGVQQRMPDTMFGGTVILGLCSHSKKGEKSVDIYDFGKHVYGNFPKEHFCDSFNLENEKLVQCNRAKPRIN